MCFCVLNGVILNTVGFIYFVKKAHYFCLFSDGEIEFFSFAAILERALELRRPSTPSGSENLRFFDLGSGTGKVKFWNINGFSKLKMFLNGCVLVCRIFEQAVIAAALLYSFETVSGIELLPTLHSTAKAILREYGTNTLS